MLADRRLADPEPFGRLGETQRLGDREKGAQLIRIVGHLTNLSLLTKLDSFIARRNKTNRSNSLSETGLQR